MSIVVAQALGASVWSVRGRLLVVSLGVALAIPGAAEAAATPVSPAPNSAVASVHPVFTWTQPSNEQSQAVYIASNPAATTEGKFFDENVVDFGPVDGGARQWSSSAPLYAGSYWWLVWTTDSDTFQSFYSAPSRFTLPPSLHIASVRVQRYTFLNQANIDVRWQVNVKQPLISARAYLRRRLIWAASKRDLAFIGTVGSTFFTFRSQRAHEGARVRLVVTIRMLTTTATRTVFFRAP